MSKKDIELPLEFLDVYQILHNGAAKYPGDGWLQEPPISFTHRGNHSSMCRHLAEAYLRVDKDKDSGFDPLLHLACRALMEYTRKKRGLSLE